MKLIKLNPVTPGTRHQLRLSKNLLSKTDKFLKDASFGKKVLAGKSSINGRTTVWHKGGGCKQKYRHIDFSNLPSRSVSVCVTYDPNRNSFVSLNFDIVKKKFFRTLSTNFVYSGSLVSKGSNHLDLSLGNRTLMGSIPSGAIIHSLGSRCIPEKTVFGRSAGVFCQLVQKNSNECLVKMPSGSIKSFNSNSFATIGSVSNSQQNLVMIGKAGRNRLRGIRPTVRGVAMNPVDHPHGGRTNGGRPSVTPWGIPTKGKPTVKKSKS